MVVTLENISVSFGGKYAVRSVIEEIRPGLYGLIGPNGAGKTTLIRTILGLQPPSDGRVLVDGADIRSMEQAWKKRIGYVPQENVFYPNFTVMEFLRYMMVIKGVPAAPDSDAWLEQLVQMLHLTDYRKHRMKQLSGGTLRRAMIAAALVGKPELLVLDEPTAGLDPTERIAMRNLITGLSSGRTVILATHIAADIECIADEVLIMKAGHIIARDTPQQLLAAVRPKICEQTVSREEIEALNAQHPTANFLQTEQGFVMRYVQEADNPKPVERVTLDEVFLYYTTVRQTER